MAKKVLLLVWLIAAVVVFIGAQPAAAANGDDAPDPRPAEGPAGETVVIPASQTIVLEAGWNLISSYIEADDPDLDVIFADIAGDVVLVKNGDGQVYWPDFGIDQIGSWDVRDGYQVYMANSAALTISGALVYPPATPISMEAGWNMIGYLRDVTQTTDEALDDIGDQLLLVKDGSGRVYWPAYGIDQIGTMRPGDGYQVYLAAADILFYPDDPVTTAAGLMMSGAISYPAEVDSFVFNAAAGDAIIASLTITSGYDSAYLELFDAAGTRLTWNTPTPDGLISYNITETAEYTITVRHRHAEDTFTYNLYLQRFNNPVGAVATAYSENHSAAITAPAEINAFTFNAQAGDAIVSSLTFTSGFDSAYLELYDAAGSLLAWNTPTPDGLINYNITETAEYTIMVRHRHGEASFTYNLFLQRFNNPVGAVEMAYGDSHSGSIVEPAEIDAFTFDAQAGESIVSNLAITSGYDSAYLELYDAAGSLLAWNTPTPDGEISYNIMVTAEYTIMVRHRHGAAAFDYDLSLDETP